MGVDSSNWDNDCQRVIEWVGWLQTELSVHSVARVIVGTHTISVSTATPICPASWLAILPSPYHRTHLYLQTFHWTHSSSSWLSTGISRRGSTPIKGRGTPPTLLRPSQQIELLFPNLELKLTKKLSTINCLDLTTKMLTSAANRARAALHTFVPFCFLSSDLRFFIDH